MQHWSMWLCRKGLDNVWGATCNTLCATPQLLGLLVALFALQQRTCRLQFFVGMMSMFLILLSSSSSQDNEVAAINLNRSCQEYRWNWRAKRNVHHVCITAAEWEQRAPFFVRPTSRRIALQGWYVWWNGLLFTCCIKAVLVIAARKGSSERARCEKRRVEMQRDGRKREEKRGDEEEKSTRPACQAEKKKKREEREWALLFSKFCSSSTTC